MPTITLDARDRAVLSLLGAGPRTPEELAAALGSPPDAIAARLPDLADNALVRERDDGSYGRTESGRRVLVASGEGTEDDRVDTSRDVERAVEELDLSPEESEAVRAAFAFLRYWTEATASELRDAVYSETPAGYDSAAAWWDGCVQDALAALPGVRPPDGGGPWRYEETNDAEQETEADGRRVLDADRADYGSARHALAALDLPDAERAAVRAAFSYLHRRGEAIADEFRASVYPEAPAGYDSAAAWWDGCVQDALAALPGVEHDGESWRYRQRATGSASARDAGPGSGGQR